MLPPHRQPSGITEIPNALGTRVPPVIEGYARVLIKQAREGAHDLLEDKVEREIRRRLTVHRVGRDIFSWYTRQKIISPPEIKTCKATDRVFLSGTGHPGRTTYDLEEAPIEDDPEAPDDADTHLVTTTNEEDSILLAYSEIDWPEFRSVTDIANNLPANTRVGLSKFYDTSVDEIPALLLALDLSQGELMRIAQNVKYNKKA